MSATLAGVSLRYGTGQPALHDITLRIAPGEQVALIGPSGAGKSSLLHLLATAHAPDTGKTVVLDQDITLLRGSALQALRKQISLIQQAPPLPPRQRVITAVLAGKLGQWSTLRGLRNLVLPVDIDGARRVLQQLDIADKLFERCLQLSGGQLQRVAIARALYQQATLVLADEPVSAMDPVLASHTLAVLCDDARQRNATLIASLHAVDLALTHFPRVIGLRDGRILFNKPRETVTQADLDALYTNAQLDTRTASPAAVPITLYIPRC